MQINPYCKEIQGGCISRFTLNSESKAIDFSNYKGAFAFVATQTTIMNVFVGINGITHVGKLINDTAVTYSAVGFTLTLTTTASRVFAVLVFPR